MILVIEGIDGAGKTKLATHLATQWANDGISTMYVHNGASDHPLQDYMGQAVEALQFSERDKRGNVVIDRFNIGEQVYPFTRGRGAPLITGFQDQIFVQPLAQLGMRWIVLTPDPVVACERLRADGEDPDLTQIWRERDLFMQEYTKHAVMWPRNFRLVTELFTTEELAVIATASWN